MKLSKAFKKIAKIKDKIRVIQGAGGSSKTYSILQYLIILATKSNKKLTISICSESFPHLRRGAMKDFFDILKLEGLYTDKEHNKTNHSYTLNGCKFEFFGVEDSSKLRGARRDILFLNEANNVSHDAFTQLFMRTHSFCFLDYNPSHLSYIKEYINEDKSNFVKLTYLDNEFLAENTKQYYLDAIEKAKSGSKYWENFVRVFVYGEEGIVDGLIFENFKTGEEVPEFAEYLGSGLDFGFSNDPTALTKVYRYDNKIYLKESLYKKGLLNSQIASHILKDNEILEKVIIADSAEPKTIAELRGYNIPVMAAKKGRGSILSGIAIMQEYEFILIGENLINEFQNYCYQKNKDGVNLGIPIDDFNHAIDGIRYFFLEKMTKANAPISLKLWN